MTNQSTKLLKTRKERNCYSNDRREADRIKRDSNRRINKARKYLERVEIKLVLDLPQTLEEFDDRYKNRNIHVRGVNCFLRHELTNYDAICNGVFHQFRVSLNEDLKKIIHDRIQVVTGRYLQSIGWFQREASKCQRN